ncbi:NAD(P)H-quinone oxidoreductase [Rhizobiales bacterium L72]|uniref:NAD(P)H-quinone oxidoreductase n=2 Tax=Propylenella binzhouense TaxID=2555902 RepID=A0A964WTL8_9HYPH|nr:NAD(P)H-quinone oxidoreductase [Propylenella binzhouense]
MTAVAIREPGGPEVLVPEARPVPELGPGEILVRVKAAGVNRPDATQRTGNYAPPPGVTDIPGLEIAGEVAKVGRSVSRWQEGDAVVALVPGGGYAEFCVVHESNALPLPAPLSWIEGAGIPETTFTVWHNVFQRGGLRRGDSLLIHGGTSGIGTTAIQLGKAFGAFVATTVGSDDKRRIARDLGADAAINYVKEDFVAAVRNATGGHGADVILDMVGGSYIDRNYEAAAEDGRIIQIAFLEGAIAEADFRKLMLKRLVHTGSTLRPRTVAFKAEVARSLEESVWPVIANGKFRPVVDSVFPLREAAEAHRRLDAADHVGKIVLTVGS